MHAVINRLTLAKPIDSSLLQRFEQQLGAAAKKEAGFVALHLVSVSEAEAVVLVMFESRAAMEDISSRVAGPWFAEAVRPYLGGPTQRATGEIIASVEREPSANHEH